MSDVERDLWKWIDLLTEPRRKRFPRDGGAWEWFTAPSLWRQMRAAVASSSTGAGGRTSPGSKAPADVGIISLMTEIEREVWDALLWHDKNPHLEVDRALRQLAVTLVAEAETSVLDHWAQLSRSWVTQAENALGGEDGGPETRDLRGAECPSCEAETVCRVEDGETYRDSALFVMFREHMVQWAQCRACGASWWRGSDLSQLAAPLVSALDDGSVMQRD